MFQQSWVLLLIFIVSGTLQCTQRVQNFSLSCKIKVCCCGTLVANMLLVVLLQVMHNVIYGPMSYKVVDTLASNFINKTLFEEDYHIWPMFPYQHCKNNPIAELSHANRADFFHIRWRTNAIIVSIAGLQRLSGSS